MRIFAFILSLLASSAHAVEAPPSGRWTGEVLVPGRPLGVVVDLSGRTGGEWIGSITITALGIKGAPLSKITVSGPHAEFLMAGALGSSPDAAAVFSGTTEGRETWRGTFTQGGHTARFRLKRIGSAQVELPVRSTSVEPPAVGAWRGNYDLDGYPHQVVLTLANHPDAAATAEFVVVGKASHHLAVDLITDDEGLIRVESHEYGMAFEGRLGAGGTALTGKVEQGAQEAPIVLVRSTGGAT